MERDIPASVTIYFFGWPSACHNTIRARVAIVAGVALCTAAEQALQLWGDGPAIALSDLAEEITTGIRLLRLAETERARHEATRDDALTPVDPDGLATSLPG